MIFGLTKRLVIVDAETSSAVDIKKHGGDRYWNHNSTRVLMIGAQTYGQQGSSVLLWEPREGAIPRSLIEAAQAPREDVMLAAYHAAFDRNALAHVGVETPHEKWIDIMMLAYALSFAGGLDAVLKQFELGVSKKEDGKRLIQLFSKAQQPWYKYPTEWSQFREYCKQDVEVENKLLAKCLRWLNQPRFQPQMQVLQRQWEMDQRINERGMPICKDTVLGALKIKKQETTRLLAWMKEKTGLNNPNSRDQLLSWCHAQGVHLDNLQAGTILEILESEWLPAHVKEVLEARLQVGKASVKKYDALERMHVGWKLRNCYTTLGASRTGRAASRGMNVANIERPKLTDTDTAADAVATGDLQHLQMLYDKPVMEVLGSCVRSTIKAPKGQGVTALDLKSIESVGLAWLAGCDTILDLFHQGKDSYKYFASIYYQVPYAEVTKQQRNFSKPPFLGFGYGASGAALVTYARDMGVHMDISEANRAIKVCRNEFKEIPAYWTVLENAAKDAITYPGNTFYAYAIKAFRYHGFHEYRDWPYAAYRYEKPFLMCRLPSGRTLFYYNAKVVPTYDWRKSSIKYEGRKQEKGGAWHEINTWGAMLAENVTQAMCRDILYSSLEDIDKILDVELIGDTYDEAITLTPTGERAYPAYEAIEKALTTKREWMDGRFYLACDGYLNSPRYKK